MIIKKKHYLLLIIALYSLLSANKVDNAYNQMINAYTKITSWQAGIIQTNYFYQTKATLKSTGNFYYQKGRIAIRYNKPNEQRMLIQNGTITIYDKASNSFIKSALVSSIQSLNPVDIVKAYWQKSEKSIISETAQSIVLSIKPFKDEQIREIKATVSNQTGFITKFVYTDTQGNSVTIAFSNMKVNKPISASAWKLNIPRNAKGLSN